MTDCAHCVWGQRAEDMTHVHPAAKWMLMPRPEVAHEGVSGEGTRHAAKFGGRARVARSLHICTSFWPLPKTSEGHKGRREPKAATGCPWILLVSVPKGNCSACLIYGCESATKLKLRNSETEAEARTETVISCDAWPKPQRSPLPPLPIRSIHGNLAHETRHLSLISPECSALSPEIWGVHVMEPSSLN